MGDFGKAIREQRKKLKLKVYELANKVGVNPVYITQIEKQGKLPSLEVVKKIKMALHPESVNLGLLYMQERDKEILNFIEKSSARDAKAVKLVSQLKEKFEEIQALVKLMRKKLPKK